MWRRQEQVERSYRCCVPRQPGVASTEPPTDRTADAVTHLSPLEQPLRLILGHSHSLLLSLKPPAGEEDDEEEAGGRLGRASRHPVRTLRDAR
ncbi:hypothetical protein CDD83_2220 [Cordyceps sp. RAO-2017]|nr:hypothetical protein CDD83_2220 [Cordyceps sp. RAO-2017]